MNELVRLCENALSEFSGIYLIDTRADKSYSYNDIKELVEEVSKKIKSFELIAIKLENRVEFISYYLASIVSCKNILILNPGESKEASLVKIKDLGCKSLLVDKDFIKNDLNDSDEEVIVLDPHVYVGTSATTGLSKLVPQSYKNIESNIKSILDHHQLEKGITIATALPLFHVNALYFSFLAGFVSGSRLVLLDSFNLLNHAILCQKYQVDILSTIPILINQYLRNSEAVLFEETGIRYFVSAAAPLSKETLVRFLKRYQIKILQGYGLSEAINFSCTMPANVTNEEYLEAMMSNEYPSVGVALTGNDVEILIDENKFAPAEILGEIIINGDNVFSGYYKSDNSEVFWNGYLKTGDLGYFKIINKRKYFFVTGRKKEVAKINGNSVSLRFIDEEWGNITNISNDFFSTSFFNENSGELLGAIVQVDSESIDQETYVEYLVKKFDSIKSQFRPSVLLLIEDGIPIRTPSGKTKRWFFRECFKHYTEFKKTKSIQVEKLYKKDFLVK